MAGRALLIVGSSGCGKSALALELLAFGAGLVADDQTLLSRDGDRVVACAPPSLPAMIEARGIGLLRITLHPGAPLAAVVDMDRGAPERLPSPAHCDILGWPVPLIAGRIGPHLAAALVQYLKSGLAELE